MRTREVDGRVRIVGTVLGQPAWRDGLAYGDDILAIGEDEVTDYDSFATALRSYSPGATVEFRVARFGSERSIHVTLGARSVPVYRLEEVEEPSDLQLRGAPPLAGLNRGPGRDLTCSDARRAAAFPPLLTFRFLRHGLRAKERATS